MVESVDPKGYVVTYDHDGLGQVTQKSEDLGSGAAIVTQWQYDELGNVAKLIDQNGPIILQGFDELNRLTGRDVTRVVPTAPQAMRHARR